MKPSFALSLSFDGIRLLHRAAGGWRSVGEVALDSSDMAGELAILRRTATGLEPGALRTKVLLPNEQIKYLTIDTPGLDDADRRAAAQAALDGATPYAVADLSFDISTDGDKTHIAAVARETLAEAESFALDHRFHPVSWAAIPGENAYLGEPFFGVAPSAKEILGADETVEPDGIAVVIVGSVTAPSGPVATAPSADAEPEAAPAREATPEPTGPMATAPEPQPDTEDETQTVAETAEDAVATTIAASPDPEPPAGTEPDPEPLPPEPAQIVAQDPPPPAAIGFASRRNAENTASPKLGGVRRDAPPAQGAVIAAHLDIEQDAAPDPLPDMPPAPVAEPAAEPRSGFLSRRKADKPETASMPATDGAAAITEEDRMTVFGNRRGNVGGKPRFLGLILTAALLVFLAGVAAWASVFLDNGMALSRLFGDREAPTTLARAPQSDADIDAPAIASLPDVQMPDAVRTAPTEPEIRTASLDPSLSSEDAAVLDALSEPAIPQAPEPLTDTEVTAKYAATGIWPRGPQVPPEPAALISIEDLYLTSIDPVSTAADAIALQGPLAFDTDTVLASVSSPAAAGTLFELDATGLVVPTAQGALSPDGFTVFLGPPPLVPPATPTRFQSVPEDTAVRSALAAVRPTPRPADLVEKTERAQLDGLTRSELAQIRPELRPQSLQQQAEAAAAPEPEPEAEPIVTDGAVAIALATPNTIENATKQAVRASIRPDGRPRNFARIVKRAQRAAPEEPVRVASAAGIAPRTVKPKIPSSASVARQATVKNAINLRKVNLIGVYGKPSSRRALVRLGNGRYKKVVVGDRIDGGKVSAIGESELRYVKKGRNVTLKMPR